MCLVNQVRCPELDGSMFYKFFFRKEHPSAIAKALYTISRTCAIEEVIGSTVTCDNKISSYVGYPSETLRFGIIESSDEAHVWCERFLCIDDIVLYKVQAFEVYLGTNISVDDVIDQYYPVGYSCQKFILVEKVKEYKINSKEPM